MKPTAAVARMLHPSREEILLAVQAELFRQRIGYKVVDTDALVDALYDALNPPMRVTETPLG